MRIEGFAQLMGNQFHWTGIYCEVDFAARTYRVTTGADQAVEVELPPDI